MEDDSDVPPTLTRFIVHMNDEVKLTKKIILSKGLEYYDMWPRESKCWLSLFFTLRHLISEERLKRMRLPYQEE